MRQIWFGNDVLDEHVLKAVRELMHHELDVIVNVTQRLLVESGAVKYPAIEQTADRGWVIESLERLERAGRIYRMKSGGYAPC
jgi:hypothetical protein